MQTHPLATETWDTEPDHLAAHLADRPHTGPTPYDENPLAEQDEGDLDAELEALFAEHPDLSFEPRPNRAQRRKAEKSVTRFVTMYRGRREWAPTAVPPPMRIAAGRRRAKAARAARKLNR